MSAVRVLAYALLLIGLQGALTRLLPAQISPPDLFLLTGVALALRLRPLAALLSAYGVGLVQDVLGHGVLGLHAAGVAGGVLLVVLLRTYLTGRGAWQLVATVVAAVAGQWLTFLALTYWLRNGLVTVGTLYGVLPALLITTLLAAPLWERVSGWAFGPRANPEEGWA